MSDQGNPNDPGAWGTPPPGGPGAPGTPGQPGWGAPPPGYGQQPQWGQGAPQQYGQGYGQPGYPPGYGGYYAAPQNDGKAIGALVCGIASFVVCPFVLAVVGLILAGQASRSIQQSGGRLTGESLVTAARVISWINIALCAVGMLFIIAAFASVSTTAT